MIRVIMLTLVFALSCVTGCSQGSGKEWDWFGLKKDKSETNDTYDPAQDPPEDRRTTSANRKNGASRELTEDDARAARVNGDVANYTSSVGGRNESANTGNDLDSKISRQNDPNRSTRIRQTAAKTRSGPGAYDSGSDMGKASPAMERGNYPPTATASPSRSQQLEPAPQPIKAQPPTQVARAEPAVQPAPTRSSAPVRSEPTQQTSQLKPGVYENADTMAPIGETRSAPPQSPPQSEPGNVLYSPSQKPVISEPPVAKSDPDSSMMTDKEVVAEPPPPAAEEKIVAAPAPAETSARPPVISEVKVAAADTTKPKTIAAPPERIATNSASPAVLSPEDATAEKIAEQEKLVTRDPNNLEEQFRLRLMYLVNGQDDRALAPTPGVNEEIQEIMQGHIHSVMTARSTSERDPATWANRQLDAIENLRSLVRSKADLRVPKLELCSAIDGFGRYEPITPAQFTVGAKNLVLLYIEVDNFKCEETSKGMYRTLLTVRQSLLDHSGQELWKKKDENIEDLARRRRTDFFLTIGPLAIPKTLGPGEYVMKVEVEDVLAGKMNGSSVKFKMVP